LSPNHKPETPEILEIWKSLKSLNPWKFGDVEIFKSFKIFLKCYAKTFRFYPQILEILEILETWKSGNP